MILIAVILWTGIEVDDTKPGSEIDAENTAVLLTG